MLEAYGKRRKRELHELGIVFNLAMNAPKELEILKAEEQEEREMGPKWW